MRGPGMRVKYDVRRTWKCPQCGYVRRVAQTETAVRCHCSSDRPFMKLVEPQRVVRPVTIPLDPYVTLEDFPDEAADQEPVRSEVAISEMASVEPQLPEEPRQETDSSEEALPSETPLPVVPTLNAEPSTVKDPPHADV